MKFFPLGALLFASISVLLFSAFLSAENTESRTIQAAQGDTVTLPLEPPEGIWEHRVITPEFIAVTEQRQLEGRVELVLSMLHAGSGRLEAVRILTNRVVDRKYFFFRIEAKPLDREPDTQAAAEQRETRPRGGQQESAEQQELAFAMRMFGGGEYDAALQAFTLFREKYPQSAELGQIAVYEGEALHALGRYTEAQSRLLPAVSSADERVRSLAQFWLGAAAAALGNTDAAIAAYLRAFAPQHPDIDIRARTGLAVAYGKKGLTNLADEQFKRLFALYAATRDQNEGYLPALFHAASFYDRDLTDAELAVRYYQDFITLAKETLARSETNEIARERLSRQITEADARLAYLRRTFTDYK